MQPESYTLAAGPAKSWMKIDNYSSDTAENRELSFLYIGKEDAIKHFSHSFKTGTAAADFSEAEAMISKFTRSNAPDAIFIDLALNNSSLHHFCAFLKENNIDSKTVIIYNEEKLDTSKIKTLKANGLVDDVLDLNSEEINYANKISFLKRIKSRQSGLSVSKESAADQNADVYQGAGVKRVIDVLLAGSAIICLTPFFLLIAIAIRFESKGPVIYTSSRAGKGWRVFKFFKFRTMEVDADKRINELTHLNQYQSGEGRAKFLKISNDPRITKVGKILRNTSLDELPQLFNVLKGDMSLVGNRPLPLYEASTLTTNEFVERFMAPAGITGLWQIKKRGKDTMSTEERISLDISYARKANVAYDLWIMAKTPTVLFQKSNV